MPSILVIDDDQDICLVLTDFLSKNQYQVHTATTGRAGLQQLQSNQYDLVLCDYKLPDITGVKLLQQIKALNPTVAIVIITGYSDINTAVEAFRYGANDFVTKPLYPEKLLLTVKETIAKNVAKSGNNVKPLVPINSSKKAESHYLAPTTPFTIGISPQSQLVQRHIELIAPADITVLISGETGTGKEFVAQSIHKYSKRSTKPFVAIDCGAMPKELAGSELFGHMKGSFTGAIADKQGSFEVANGGTLFLDEIGNLSIDNQIKLLWVIQERKIKRIGGTKDIPIDIRIIAATHENLMVAVKEGRLREDLYQRLNEFKIHLAPLRDRKDDIIYFADYFLKTSNDSLGKTIKGFSADVIPYFSNYFWNGNLRELNNVIKRAVLLTTGDTIEVDSLPTEIIDKQNISEGIEAGHENIGMLKSITWTAERQAIMDVLEKVNYNKSKAAELLNIDRKTLYNKLKIYNITE
jgi:two-component system response regulator HydG